ncbi:MAG: efflux RND transporter periplasmic adaptor subunit [Vicinamibacteria bacterium]|nr:efflux RND transporter periplasmic adaptor subunit [Vicinamibacteria bacterium]
MIAFAAGCGGGGAAGPPPAPGPTPVGIQILVPKPVTITSEFVGVLKSRRSSEIRPQVDGIITQIFVKSGDRVAPGRALLQIDPQREQAALESNQASRVAQEAAVRFAQQQYDRAKQLLDAGAMSQQEFEQAETNVNTASAALEALKARERQAGLQLQYFRVTSPTGGVVGDIPVRVGDRVTTSTVLTTVDQQAGLEAYVQIPIERAPEVRVGLPVRLTDAQGAVLAETAIDFVSPQVDDRTQSVLVKAPVPASRGFRTEQFVRALVVWRNEPGLTLPTTAVTRINGQYFVFVAEPAAKGFLARQHAVKLGELRGNEYVLIEGLKAGDRLIVSGVQKVRDGAPVAPQG